jgi:molybdenum cofactor cytidylyltransferase
VLAAVILAAGDSTRMGSPKAILDAPDGRPFIASIVRALGAAGISDIVIVTGRDHDRVIDALDRDAPPVRARAVRNADPSRGQLSSLWLGMDASIGPDTKGLLVTLVDVPLVAPGTIGRVVEAWRRTRAPIVRPAIGDRHGHPVIFDRALFDELRAAPLETGAKAVVRAHAAEIMDVPVDDEGSLTDVDTPADYAALLRQATEARRGEGHRDTKTISHRDTTTTK